MEYTTIITASAMFAFKLLEMDFKWFELEGKHCEYFSNPLTPMCFSKDTFTIFVNVDTIEHYEEGVIILQTIHECRHFYQALKVKYKNDFKTKEVVPINAINKWEYELSNYVTTTNILSEDETYLNQEIEIDAIAFEYLIGNKYFDIFLEIPEIVKDKVFNRVKELERYY